MCGYKYIILLTYINTTAGADITCGCEHIILLIWPQRPTSRVSINMTYEKRIREMYMVPGADITCKCKHDI